MQKSFSLASPAVEPGAALVLAPPEQLALATAPELLLVLAPSGSGRLKQLESELAPGPGWSAPD